MSALAIVEDLEVFEDRIRQLDSGPPDPAVEEFDLHPAPERLDERVVVATALPDGRVLIVGGYGPSFDSHATAELYDPTTGQFVPTGSPVNPRNGHTATLLQDGRVLLVGGTGTGAYNDPTPASAELYDPTTGKFILTGSMTTRRWSGHTATLLKDGRVLLDGGNGSGVQEVPLASAELYDPKTGRFSKTGSMALARDTQSATLLLDGRVLVVDGADQTAKPEPVVVSRPSRWYKPAGMVRGHPWVCAPWFVPVYRWYGRLSPRSLGRLRVIQAAGRSDAHHPHHPSL